ncbi:MAG: GTPase [Candidatus Diapherotrites archaeon]
MQFYAIESPEKLVENAFSHARRNSNIKRSRKSTIQHRKEKVLRRMELFYDYLEKQLDHLSRSVPRIDKLHPFYQELLPETIQVGKVKQAASQIISVRKLLKRQLIQGKKAMYHVAPDALVHMKKESARYYGRCANIMKSLKENIIVLQTANQQLKEVPDVRIDIPTIVLAGFPNTGKTTMLKRLTTSKAIVASYPFTTKSLQLGYFSMRYREVQVMDTPGLLDQINREWNTIEKKALAGLKHLATCILFIVDPTSQSGYTLEQQHQLLMRLKTQFPAEFIIILNKCDISTTEQLNAAHAIFGIDAIREGEGIESNLKDKLWRALGFGRTTKIDGEETAHKE